MIEGENEQPQTFDVPRRFVLLLILGEGGGVIYAENS